jgi:hypothetical protein
MALLSTKMEKSVGLFAAPNPLPSGNVRFIMQRNEQAGERQWQPN